MEKKGILIIAALIFILILILFGAKIYLVINYLLGNDVLINTIPNTENIFLVHGESKPIDFKISILANPFCQVECNYIFEDISEDKIYDNGTLNVKLTEPITKEYKITSPVNGVGQKLYQFSTSCTAIKTPLCNTEGKLTKKTVLVTMDYNYTSEEEEIRENTIANYPIFLGLANNLTGEIYNLNKTIQKIENISISEYKTNWALIEDKNKNISEQMKTITTLWDSERLSDVKNFMSNINATIIKTNSDFQKLNESVLKEVKDYNLLILNISIIEREIKIYSRLNLTKTTASYLDEIILEFNSLKNSFLVRANTSDKKAGFDEFYNNYSIVKTKIENERIENVDKNFRSSKELSNISLEIILSDRAENLTFINYSLTNPTASCCLKGKCFPCCKDSCYDNSSLYPIIFIHGHDFSASISPEYNLEIFKDIQNKLEEEGYINAGSILINVPESTIKGIWGETPNTIGVGASYYFDSIRNQSVFNVLQAKKDNIDTYSIRLKNIIDTVKYKTNKKKVIIISHSMGGLVARRYVQLFGDDSVGEIIMVTSPNNGIGSETLKFCKLFGAEKECDDMYEGSVLVNKLSAQTGFNIPVYNIIGIGCNTYGENGDGIVTNRSAYLNWTYNYYVNGTCQDSKFKYLHSEIIYPDEYLQTYEIIKNILKGNTTGI